MMEFFYNKYRPWIGIRTYNMFELLLPTIALHNIVLFCVWLWKKSGHALPGVPKWWF